MNGEELFQLSKNTLDQFTNETESARIYKLLSQQKKLSGVRILFLRFLQSFTSFSSIDLEISLTNHRVQIIVPLVRLKQVQSMMLKVNLTDSLLFNE
jgi:hypothetical protein